MFKAKKAILKEIEADKKRRQELKSSLVNTGASTVKANLKNGEDECKKKDIDESMCRIQVGFEYHKLPRVTKI